MIGIFFFSCNQSGQKTNTNTRDSLLITEGKISHLIAKDSLDLYYENQLSDSLKLFVASEASYRFYKKMDTVNFKKWNLRSLKLSRKARDTNAIAISYWDLGNYFYQLGIKDSSFRAYKNAYENFRAIERKLLAGKMLLNMAVIQTDIKDYTGSEVTTVRAIRLLEPLNDNDQLYRAYNNLGILSNGLNNINKAVDYHQKALEIAVNEQNFIRQAASLNNIGVVYQNDQNYAKAVDYYARAANISNLEDDNIRLFAMILDNRTYSKMKIKDTTNALTNFRKTEKIRDSLEHYSGQVVNKLHLGEYFLEIEKDTIKAIEIFQKARELAATTYNNRDLLKSLEFLTMLDKNNDKHYFKQYLTMSDSLDNEERLVKNKFARIQFETDQFIAENKSLTNQRGLIIFFFSAVLIILTLTYIITHQKIKNKKLFLEKRQQENNEEIYNLLLSQNNKLQEGRQLAKKNISSELHDGVLGKLFGIRLTLESLNGSSSEEAVAKRAKSIDNLEELEAEIRNLSHDLVKFNSNKDVDLINIIKDFIEINQENFKGKINLSSEGVIEWDFLTNKAKIHIYRTVQEAVFNSLKYAKSSRIDIKFKQDIKGIILNIQDNGVGFDPEKVKRGLGINNIEERIGELRGTVRLQSDRHGTFYKIFIPVTYKW